MSTTEFKNNVKISEDLTVTGDLTVNGTLPIPYYEASSTATVTHTGSFVTLLSIATVAAGVYLMGFSIPGIKKAGSGAEYHVTGGTDGVYYTTKGIDVASGHGNSTNTQGLGGSMIITVTVNQTVSMQAKGTNGIDVTYNTGTKTLWLLRIGG